MSQDPNTKPPASAVDNPTSASESASRSSDYAAYPTIDPNDVAPPPVNWSSVPVGSNPRAPDGTPTTMPAESNPYVSPSPVPLSKNKLDSIKDVLGTWGKKAAEATKKAENMAGDMWQHLKTGPSFADAAVGRIAQGTKVLAEGGYEKVFRQTFETVPEEQLLKSFACYLSTSAGPVMGTLYLSSAKLAFCSDNPLPYKVGEETQWSYYKLCYIQGMMITECKYLEYVNQVCGCFIPVLKLFQVVIPLHQLKAVNPSTSKINSAEKYIQIISVDNHEFWLMGFVNYESAVKNLKSAMDGGNIC